MPAVRIARHFEQQTWDAVQCVLCPHHCSIAASRQGICGVRVNRNGLLHTLTYGRVADSAPIPVEDIPLFHFHPGSRWLRVGSIGCTMHCPFCNTWRFSQVGGVRTRYVNPPALVQEALQVQAAGIAFMMNEPAVWHEYILDVAAEAHKQGLLIAATTAGMWATEPFAEALGSLDAVVFGLKGFESSLWSVECGGALEQTRVNLEAAATLGRHIEVTYLVIETLTDSTEQVGALGHWLAEVGPNIPIHVLGYRPDFHWNRPAASNDSIRKVAELVSELMPFVYGDHEEAGMTRDTRCPSCSRVVVTRSKIRGTAVTGIRDAQCADCGARLPIVLTATG